MNVVGNLAVILSANGAPLMSALNTAKGALSSFSAQAGAFANITLGSVGLTTSLGALGAQAVIAGVQTAASFEQAQISFETMIGSAEKASGLLGGIRRMAAETPFQTTDLTKAAQQLLIYGVEAERILPVLTRLGDMASAAPEGAAEGMSAIIRALGQMKQAGKVNAQDMMQLTNAGVPAWDALAKHVGVTTAKIRDMVSGGAVDASKGWNAIMALAASPKYAGLMAKQAQSVSGLWSSVKDNAVLALEGIGAAMAVVLKPSMASLNDEAGKFGSLFEPAAASVHFLADAFAIVKYGIKSLFPAMREYVWAPILKAMQYAAEFGQTLAESVGANDLAATLKGKVDLAKGRIGGLEGGALADLDQNWKDLASEIERNRDAFEGARKQHKAAGDALDKFAKDAGKAEEATARLAAADVKRAEEIRAAGDPLANAGKNVEQLQRLYRAGEIDQGQYWRGTLDAFDELSKFADVQQEPKLSGALRVGSSEAVSALNKDLLRSTAGSPEDRVVKVMEAVKLKIDRQTAMAQRVAEAIEERGIGVLKE